MKIEIGRCKINDNERKSQGREAEIGIGVSDGNLGHGSPLIFTNPTNNNDNMRKIFARMRNAYHEWRFDLSTRRNARRNTSLQREADQRVQVREFGGRLCLSIDGIPLLAMETYNVRMLEDARTTLFNYLKAR